MRRTPHQRRATCLSLERLEGRDVPAVFSTLREATGANAAAIQAAVDAFRADLGTLNANNPGSVGTGRREINWDANAPLDATSSPTLMPAGFFNQAAAPFARGAVFTTSPNGTGVIVSQDDDNPADADPDQVRFSDINATYTTAFATFSAQRLFAAAGSNIVDIHFFIPGSATPALSRGFGAVFTDVDTAGSTKLEFFDAAGNLIRSQNVLATAGDGSFSFLGVTFTGACVAGVRITAGAATLGPNDITQGGAADLVVMDDFIYGEPVLPALFPLAVSGQTNASAQTFTADRTTGQYATTAAATLNPFGAGTTNIRSAVGDVDGDCVPDTVLVTGPGTPIRLAVVSGANNTTLLVQPFDPFGGNFTGGGFVSTGDLNGDGNVEFVVSPDQGGGPRVTIFSLVNGVTVQRANFFGIDDANFRGGARTALGDINADGRLDLAVAAGFQGGPRTALFNGTTLFGTPTRLIGDFFAFPGADATNLRNGVFVASGDINGDGSDDLIFGGGPGGAPRVFILSGVFLTANQVAAAQAAPIANFFVAGNANDRGGVRLATTDADGDARADLAAGSGEGSAARVRTYLGKNFTAATEPTTFQDLTVFGGTALAGGVFVG